MMRYAHGVHPSRRDVPIHLAAAPMMALHPGPDRIDFDDTLAAVPLFDFLAELPTV
jgi:hypothetical protein